MTPPIVKNRAPSQPLLAPAFEEWQAPATRLPPGIGAGRFWDANGKTVRRPFYERKKKEPLPQNVPEANNSQVSSNIFEARSVNRGDHDPMSQMQNKTNQEVNMKPQKQLVRDTEGLVILPPMPAPLRSHPPMEVSQKSPSTTTMNANNPVMVEKRSEMLHNGVSQSLSVLTGRPISLDRPGRLVSKEVKEVVERPRSLLPGHARQTSIEGQSPRARARSIMQHELFLTDLPTIKPSDPVSPVVRMSTAPTPKTRELSPGSHFRQRAKSTSHELFLSGFLTAATAKSMPGSPRMGVELRDEVPRTRSPSPPPPPTPRKDTPKPTEEHLSKPKSLPPVDPNIISNRPQYSNTTRPSLISVEAQYQKTHKSPHNAKSSSTPRRVPPEFHPQARARAKSVSQEILFYPTHRPNLKSSHSAQNLQTSVIHPNGRATRTRTQKPLPVRLQKAPTTPIRTPPRLSMEAETKTRPGAQPEIHHANTAPAKLGLALGLRGRRKPRPDLSIMNSHRLSIACYHSFAELPPSPEPTTPSSVSTPSQHETTGFRSPQPGQYGDSKFNTLPGESYPFGQAGGPVELEASVPGSVGVVAGMGKEKKDRRVEGEGKGEFVLPESLVVNNPDWDLLPMFARFAGREEKVS